MIDEIVGTMTMVAEVVKRSPSVLELTHRYGVEMPITEQSSPCAIRVSRLATRSPC